MMHQGNMLVGLLLCLLSLTITSNFAILNPDVPTTNQSNETRQEQQQPANVTNAPIPTVSNETKINATTEHLNISTTEIPHVSSTTGDLASPIAEEHHHHAEGDVEHEHEHDDDEENDEEDEDEDFTDHEDL